MDSYFQKAIYCFIICFFENVISKKYKMVLRRFKKSRLRRTNSAEYIELYWRKGNILSASGVVLR